MEYLNVGKIVNTQGLHGEVRVIAQTDSPKLRFQVGKFLTLFSPQGEVLNLEIKTTRNFKKFIILSFVGLESINDVEKYRNSLLKIPISDLESLPKNEFYYYQIIGLEVIDERGNIIGKIKEILAPGANDVWVVSRPHKKDAFIPYIEQVVKKVDLDSGQVFVELMEGLIDDEN